jgi:CHAT domain
VIFDGHSHHNRTTGLGTLRVGKEDISIWDMRAKVRVPPIVILSACDTHATDRSHATTANGFLNAGAITVVASLLPVKARDAAMLIARLIWRLAEFLPAITSDQGRAVLWSEVMSGMLRLQLVYDLVMPLSMEGEIDEKEYKEISMRAVIATTNRDPNWWDDALDRVGDLIGEDREALKERAARVIATSDAIRYTQLGNPEKIVIKSRALLRAMEYDV